MARGGEGIRNAGVGGAPDIGLAAVVRTGEVELVLGGPEVIEVFADLGGALVVLAGVAIACELAGEAGEDRMGFGEEEGAEEVVAGDGDGVGEAVGGVRGGGVDVNEASGGVGRAGFEGALQVVVNNVDVFFVATGGEVSARELD